jgi:hypothetical protein
MKKRAIVVLLVISLFFVNALAAQASLKYVDLRGNWRVVYESTDAWQTTLAYRMKQGWGYFWQAYKDVRATFGSTGLSSSWWFNNRIKIYLKDPVVMDGSYGSTLVGSAYMKLNDEAASYGDLSVNALNFLGSVVAHEFGHIVFFQRTQYHKSKHYDFDRVAYLTEGLSWYIGCMVYRYRDSTYNEFYTGVTNLKQQLNYWDEEKWESSWYITGWRYYNPYSSGQERVYWRLIGIGYFLTRWPSPPNPSYSRISTLMDNIKYYCYYQNDVNFDRAYQAVYGYPGEHTSTSSGPSVNTLYSKYYYWYHGSWNYSDAL